MIFKRVKVIKKEKLKRYVIRSKKSGKYYTTRGGWSSDIHSAWWFESRDAHGFEIDNTDVICIPIEISTIVETKGGKV